MLATSIAEEMRSQGKKVLLILDSLTRVAHAAREIGMLLGEPGAARGYPPSALSTITKLIERAGNSAETGGAITGIYTVLADGDDQNDPVVDTARSILDAWPGCINGMASCCSSPSVPRCPRPRGTRLARSVVS